jgi:hypothetical protein
MVGQAQGAAGKLNTRCASTTFFIKNGIIFDKKGGGTQHNKL